ncbi:toprim domain-containing protein [Caproiciproducens sp. CPB-2]|uniref:toprim domain-containing protein n=1 Tax=Caproiciproducens sp. CPB-2 TaxID=3030017 RepID=UPI003FA4061E
MSDTIQPARPRRLIRKERLTLTEKPYRGDVDGSEKDFFFNYHGGSERLYVFEAPIDMLSFITLNKREGWQKHSYLALGCTAPLALLRFLSEYLGIHQIVLCMDNDAAGIKADAIIQETLHRLSQGMYVEDLSEETREQLQRPYEVSILKSIKKDWNDDLKYG